MGVRYLETEEIMRIHEDIIQESGGYSGMLSYSKLDFAVAQAKLSKDLDRAAATLFYGIIDEPSVCRWEQENCYGVDRNLSQREREKVLGQRRRDLGRCSGNFARKA